jgi:hypothetical protein
MLFQATLLVRLLISKRGLVAFKSLTKIITNGSVRKEARTKKAATFKVNEMVSNAMELHDDAESYSSRFPSDRSGQQRDSTSTVYMKSTGRFLLNFQAVQDRFDESGGLLWAWKRVLTGSLFEEEGIWFHGRLVASNVYQLFICVVVLSTIGVFPRYVEEVEPGPRDEITPERWMIEFGVILGGLAGFAAALSIALVYLASSVSTVLQFRHGVSPSLGSGTFQKYRVSRKFFEMIPFPYLWSCLHPT